MSAKPTPDDYSEEGICIPCLEYKHTSCYQYGCECSHSQTEILRMTRDQYHAEIYWDRDSCLYQLHWGDGIDGYDENYNELHYTLSRLASLDELGTDGFRRHFKYEAGPFCEAADRFFEEVNGWT